MTNSKLKHVPNNPVPYNTGKIKIGIHYQPPQKNHMDDDNIHWQNVLTGVYQERIKHRAETILYVLALTLVCIFLWGTK